MSERKTLNVTISHHWNTSASCSTAASTNTTVIVEDSSSGRQASSATAGSALLTDDVDDEEDDEEEEYAVDFRHAVGWCVGFCAVGATIPRNNVNAWNSLHKSVFECNEFST